MKLPALSCDSTCTETSRCRHRSFVKAKASSPNGSPSLAGAPLMPGRAPRGQLMPAENC